MQFPIGSRVYQNAERILGNRVAACFVCNSFSGAEYHVNMGYKKEKMFVIPNGLTIPDKKFSEFFSNKEKICLGMICRLHPMKDIPTMLKALSLIMKRQENLSLKIWGNGEPEYVKKLKNYCLQLKIDKMVHWKGWGENVWDILDQIDILVSTSSYGEGMSNTIMEAMAAQKVIVATDVGDARLMLSSGDTNAGYLVQPSDPKAVADAIMFAIENKKESAEMAKKGKEIVEKRYSMESMVSSYIKLFESRNLLL